MQTFATFRDAALVSRAIAAQAVSQAAAVTAQAAVTPAPVSEAEIRGKLEDAGREIRFLCRDLDTKRRLLDRLIPALFPPVRLNPQELEVLERDLDLLLGTLRFLRGEGTQELEDLVQEIDDIIPR